MVIHNQVKKLFLKSAQGLMPNTIGTAFAFGCSQLSSGGFFPTRTCNACTRHQTYLQWLLVEDTFIWLPFFRGNMVSVYIYSTSEWLRYHAVETSHWRVNKANTKTSTFSNRFGRWGKFRQFLGRKHLAGRAGMFRSRKIINQYKEYGLPKSSVSISVVFCNFHSVCQLLA